MKLKIKTNFSFSKLLNYVKSESFSAEQNSRIGSHIAESSKRFIMQGKVTPGLKKSTIKRRMYDNVNTNTPLFKTGKLANSLKATKKGIEGAFYGKYHLEGFKNRGGGDVDARNFIHFEQPKINKTLKKLISKMNKAMKK